MVEERMLQEKYPFYLANRPEMPNTDLAVTDKFSGETATRVALADEKIIHSQPISHVSVYGASPCASAA